MELETLAPSGAEAENVAPVADETLEVATPETEVEEPKDPEAEAKAERDKAIRNLQRRVDRKHAQAAAAEERARLAEQRIADIEARYSGSEEQKPQIDPIQLAEQIATIREVNTKANTVAKDGGSRFPDFKDALRTVAEEAGPLFDQRGMPTGLGESVLDADDPAAVLHYLGTNPEIASELQGLKPTQIARRIARIEADMAKPIEADMAKPKEPKQSTAPKPVAPVRQSADVGGLSDSLTTEEWAQRFYKMRRGG